jgi:hypothetical protein
MVQYKFNKIYLINKKENPVEISENIKKNIYQNIKFNIILENENFLIETKLKSIYQNSKFWELTDHIRIKKFKIILLNKIFGYPKNLIISHQLNYLIFPRICFYFLTEAILLTSDKYVNTFSILFSIIDFLTVNNIIDEALLILKKNFRKGNILELDKISKNIKFFDIFFLSKNYTKAKKILNKLKLCNFTEFSTPEISSEITYRLANFSIKENKFNSAISYLIESISTTEKFNKVKISMLVELLLFCSNFVKNFRFVYLTNKLDHFPNTFNFLFLKFLSFILKKNNLAAIDIICKNIKQNIINKNVKKIIKKIYNKVFLIKIKKISNSYLRLNINSILVILGVQKKMLSKKIEFFILTRKITCFFDKKSESFIFFEKKNQPEFFSILMTILLQLNSVLKLKLNKSEKI